MEEPIALDELRKCLVDTLSGFQCQRILAPLHSRKERSRCCSRACNQRGTYVRAHDGDRNALCGYRRAGGGRLRLRTFLSGAMLQPGWPT